jgi:ATP-dependent DNA ligase
MIDRAKLNFKGRYGAATGGAVTDHVLMDVAQQFETQVMRKFDAMSPQDLELRYAGSDQVLVATKYDGEGSYIYFERGQEPFCFSGNGGRVRLGFKALDELKSKLEAAGVQKCLLRAELIVRAPLDGTRRPGVSEVIRISFGGSEAEIENLQLVLLDAVMLDGKDLRGQQAEFLKTLELLRRLVGSNEQDACFTMAAEVVAEKAVRAAFDRVVEAGGEGVVVRRLGRIEVRKIKPHRSVDGVIMGFVEDEFEGQYGVASLLTGMVYPIEDGNVFMQTFVRVGSGLKDSERVSMLDQLRPMVVPAPLPMTDSSGRTVRFIRPHFVVELHGEDLVSTDGNKETKTQLMRWLESEQRYEFLGLSPFLRLSFARFAQLRSDKLWHQGGARIEQVRTGMKPVAIKADEGAKIIRREAYTKGEMLRKWVLVQKSDPELPYPFLVYFTDFSAKRAEALKLQLRVASHESRAQALMDAWIAEELTKGFVKWID